MTTKEHQKWMREMMLVLAIWLGGIAGKSEEAFEGALDGTEKLFEEHKKSKETA